MPVQTDGKLSVICGFAVCSRNSSSSKAGETESFLEIRQDRIGWDSATS